jgi:hypothetical protein
MGYTRNPDTGEMEPITTVTGTIHAACGCRIAYDDTDEIHRRIRLDRGFSVKCEEHGWQLVLGSAYSGPPELLWPDPAERQQALDEIAQDHQEQWWEAAGDADEDDATPV